MSEFEFRAEEGTILTFLPSEIFNDGNGTWSRGMDGPEDSIPEGSSATVTLIQDKREND